MRLIVTLVTVSIMLVLAAFVIASPEPLLMYPNVVRIVLIVGLGVLLRSWLEI